MKHLSEEQLLFRYYGEFWEGDEHLEACEECRANFRELQRTLNLVNSYTAPERESNYEVKLWARLRTSLPERKRGWWLTWRLLAYGCATAVLLIGSFFAGRHSVTTTAPTAKDQSASFERRVLVSAVRGHLDRAQYLLSEYANARPPLRGEFVPIAVGEDEIHDLLESNRLYRHSAEQAGERVLADLLDELERLFMDLAHMERKLSAEAVEDLRERIVTAGILFRVRILSSEMREREKRLEPVESGESL